MDNRFGLKDAVLIGLLVVVIAMIGLKMLQDDRQWGRFAQIQQLITEQTRDLAEMRRQISQGVAVRGSVDSGGGGADGADPFRRLRLARQHPDYAQGDWMVDAFASAVPTLNPLTAQDLYSRVVQSRVIEPLATYDIGTRELVPLLAESWVMAEDGLSATFRLRPNVYFSNGERLTADDVVYTFEINRNPEVVDGSTIEYYRNITECRKIDDLTVRYVFGRVFYENLQRAAGISILCKSFLEAYDDRAIREHTALLLGTGPYRLPDPARYEPGGTIELIRNERYWGVPGPWDRMVWKIIEKESTRQISFENGEIDLFGPTAEQHVEMLSDGALRERTQHKVYEHVRSGYTYIAWNQRRQGDPTVFADRRVRQAMTLLIDRQRLAEEVFLGFASVASGPFHHLGPQADPAVAPWPYDPAQAEALLQAAGFSRGDNGVMLGPDGRRFEIELVYPAGNDTYQKVMLAVKDNLARAGIGVNLNAQQWVLLLQTLNERNFDAISLGWGGGGIEGDIEQMFHTRTIAEGDNRNAYSNPELDALIEQAHVTLDEARRMKIWQQCHRILHEDQPYTFLFRQKSRVWIDGRIANVQEIPVLGLNHVSTWPVPIEWFVPAARQKYTGASTGE